MHYREIIDQASSMLEDKRDSLTEEEFKTIKLSIHGACYGSSKCLRFLEKKIQEVSKDA